MLEHHAIKIYVRTDVKLRALTSALDGDDLLALRSGNFAPRKELSIGATALTKNPAHIIHFAE